MIGFFHKLISVQNVEHMLQVHVAQQLPSLKESSCTSKLSIPAMTMMLSWQFPISIFLNKTLPDLFQLRTKAEKPDIQLLQHTLVNGSKAHSDRK